MSDHYGSDHCVVQPRVTETRATQARGSDPGEQGQDRTRRAKERGGERRTATRADLLDAIATTCPHLPRSEVRHVFETALEEMSDALRRGEAVKLRSFGQFAVRAKRERVGRNPRTGVEVPITPRRVLTFRPSSVLLDLVNGVPAADGGRQD